MHGTAISHRLRGLGAALLALGALATPAAAQWIPPSAVGRPARAIRPACGSKASWPRSIAARYDPAKADQIKRYEEAVGKQQAELDRLNQQAQRMGCQGGGFFALFSGQPPQCDGLNNQIQQMRANLDRFIGELQRLQGNSGDREGQRRSILVALGQNDCGPQYRQYANPDRRLLREPVRQASTPVSQRAACRTPIGRCACAPATATISRFPTRRCRASSPTTRSSASGCARRPRRCSTATAIRART